MANPAIVSYPTRGQAPEIFALRLKCPMANNNHSLTYLKFLNLAQALRNMTSFPELDPVEERLLNYFASAWLSGKTTSVLESMHASPEISPSTVHRRLKTLRKKGYIRLDIDEVDTRVKYIVQTELTQQYFSKLGECIDGAISS